jgi:Tol biopolymer transport system component
MKAERWQRISQVYGQAVACAPGARTAFLDDACAGDSALRAEIESLLRHQLPSVAALDLMAKEIAAASPSAVVGARLGPYTIRALIGEGGMGQVYRAHDSELGREVAIKVLPPIFALDADRRARFEREARMLASLNHPNIAAIYGIAEGEGLRGLVLELVEGDTLADRLRAPASGARNGSGVTVKEALLTARQIVEALDAAHEKGIVHRDLKPANIKLTSDGTVKVLDFGLAKAALDHDLGRHSSGPEGTPVGETRAGVVLGTIAYMSPEQAQGLRVDKRTDIWAFGCVLYEMLTGTPAYVGATAADTISAILEREPDWSAVPPTTASSILALLQRCLEKDPRRRLRDIGEALIVLDDAAMGPSLRAAIPGVHRRGTSHVSIGAAMIATAVIGGAIAWTLKPSSQPASPAVTRLALPVAPDQRPMERRGLAWSPDGRFLAYVADSISDFRLCVRAMEGVEIRCLAGTEGAAYPFFAPSGEWVGFFAGGMLKKVPVAGRNVTTVLDLSSRGGGDGGVWSPDDVIFFAGGDGIWSIPAAGGSQKRVTAIDHARGEISHRLPSLLPDGKTLLYTVWYGPGWDERELVAQRPEDQQRHLLVKGAATARYASSGHLIYTRAGAIMAVGFDASRLEVSGPPVTLLDDVREGPLNADYDLSPAGSLAYVRQSPGAYDRLPVLVDRKGVGRSLPGLMPAFYQNPVFSPDGRYLAVMVAASISDIWVYDFSRANFSRLATNGTSQYPVWSPDGKQIAYRATRLGRRNLFSQTLEGTAAEQRLTTGNRVQTPWSWSPDGTALAFDEAGAGTRMDIWTLPLAGTARPFLRERFNEIRPRFSPSGRRVAYMSDRSGRYEIYVESYPVPDRRWQISTGGGADVIWARDGTELFYRVGRKMMSVQVAGGADLMPSAPQFLFEGDYVFDGGPVVNVDVHPDGQRFLMIQASRPDPPTTHINVVLNLFEELKQRLPAATD